MSIEAGPPPLVGENVFGLPSHRLPTCARGCMSRRSHVTAASETAAPSGNTLSSPADTALSPASPSPLPALPLTLSGATHALPTQLAPAPQRDGPVPRGQQLPNTGRERTDPPAPTHTVAHATQTSAGAGGPLPYWAAHSHPAVPPGPARHGRRRCSRPIRGHTLVSATGPGTTKHRLWFHHHAQYPDRPTHRHRRTRQRWPP